MTNNLKELMYRYRLYKTKGKTEPEIIIIKRHLKNLSKNNYKLEKSKKVHVRYVW